MAEPTYSALAALVAIAVAGCVLSSQRVRVGIRWIVLECPPRRFDGVLFLAASCWFAVSSLAVFHGLPHIDDGVGAWFQASLFVTGRVTEPLPPFAEFFEVFGVHGYAADLGHRAGIYPPGWPALLAVGVALGVPALVNPALGAATVVAIRALGEELYDRSTGRIAALIAMASPFLWILAGTHLSHVTTALGATILLVATMRLCRGGGASAGLVAGVGWALAALTRPLDAVLAGLVAGLPFLFRPWLVLARWRGLMSAALVAVLAVATLAAFQWRTTGDPMRPGHVVALGEKAFFGISEPGGQHTLERAVDYTQLRLEALQSRLLGWPIGGLFVVGAGLVVGGLGRRELWLVTLPLLLLGVYSLFWYLEGYFPARYTSAGHAGCYVLAAHTCWRGYQRLARSTPLGARLWASACIACLVWAGTAGAREATLFVQRTEGDLEETLARVLDEHEVQHAVVFMDSIGVGATPEMRMNDFYASGFVRNPLGVDGDVIFARNLRTKNRVLAEAHPGRRSFLYRFDRDERTARFYEIHWCADDFVLRSMPARAQDSLTQVDADRMVTEVDCAAGEVRAAGRKSSR